MKDLHGFSIGSQWFKGLAMITELKQNMSIFMQFTTCPYFKQFKFSQHTAAEHVGETYEGLSSKKP